MKKLFFDIQITGHHSEYINHLVDYLYANNDLNDEYFFVVHPDFSKQFPEIVLKAQQLSNATWIEITVAEFNKSQRGGLIRSSFCLYKLMNLYADKYKINHVFLLYFNSFQIPCIFYRPNYSMSGILFLQFYRMSKSTLKDKIKYYRKYYITKLYALNPKLQRVFVLNDEKTAEYLNKEFNRAIFSMLPDPIPVYKKEQGFDVYDYYNIPKNKKILLHPGAIDPRKGTYEIIDSIDFLENKETEEYAILIVGKAKSDVENIIRRKLDLLKNKDFIIVFDNSFVSNECLKSLFLQSHAVLMPYKNAEASSGILGHATLANKCVLAPDLGLIGDIIKKYKLGILIDKPIAEDIAKGIERLSNYTNDKILAAEFVSQHTVEVFSSTLLN